MDVNVTITLTLSNQLFELIGGVTDRLTKRVEHAVTREINARVKEQPGFAVEVAAHPVVAESAGTSDEQQPTKEAVRAALDAARVRLAGADYADRRGTDPAVKQLCTAINATAIALARDLGADKPTELPGDKRQQFIDMMSELIVEDGKVTFKAPF